MHVLSSQSRSTVALGLLVQLPTQTREAIGAIRFQAGPPGVRMYLYGLSLAAPIRSADVPVAADLLDEEVATLLACGLFGGVTVARPDPLTWQVRLWSGSPAERETWERRILAAEKDPMAAALLEEGGQLRLLTWRRDQAALRVSRAVAAAVEAGMPRTRVAELAAIPRQRVYDIIGSGVPTETIFDLTDAPSPSPAEPQPRAADPAPQPVRPSQRRPPTVAPYKPAMPLPEGVERLPRGRSVPCQICGKPATETVDGLGIHLGQCLATYRQQQLPTQSPAPDADTPPEGRPDVEPPAVTPRPPAAAAARPATPAVPARRDRFAGPACALDENTVWLPGGATQPWSATHLGEVAMLVAQHRLGWGGGEDRHPDEGQVWLYAGALERLGLPADLGLGPLRDDGLPWSQSQWDKAKLEVFTRITELPAVQAALAEGWELGQGGRVDVWTRIWHPQLLRSGARLVILPWNRVQGVSVMADRIDDDDQVVYQDASPADLVARLREYAQLVGISYRLSPATTGLDLIDRCRPPRRDAQDTLGQSRNRVSVIRNQPAQLPAQLLDGRGRFANVEHDYHWWRPWTSLTDSEKASKWVVLYDRGASYLTPWSSINLGVEGLTHHVGPQANWDGSEAPAFYLVDRWEWTDWWLPDPLGSMGAFSGQDKVWVSVHTLRQLAARGVRPTIHEAYTWATAARYLEQPGTILRQAREKASAHTLPTIKSTYSAAVGKLGENEHPPTYHLWRPDWRQLIIAATRTAIQHSLIQAHETSGAIPLVADFDLIGFAVDEPRWPGPAGKEGTGLGQWKLVAAAPLADWGPTFLPTKPGRFLYKKAVDAARAAGRSVSEPPYGDSGQEESS